MEKDISIYISKLNNFDKNNQSRFLQKIIEYSLDAVAIELPEIEYSRENYNKYFNRGFIESPVATLKMGGNQFEKFAKEDRFKDENNVVIGSHNNDIDNFVKQIKTADQIIFADSEISRMIVQLNKEVGNPVSLYGMNTEALNLRYNKSDVLSITENETKETLNSLNEVELLKMEIEKDVTCGRTPHNQSSEKSEAGIVRNISTLNDNFSIAQSSKKSIHNTKQNKDYGYDRSR